MQRVARVECVPNIGPRERQKRMTFAMIGLLLAALLWGWLASSGLARAFRLTLFFPLLASGIGFFQAWFKTCIALSARDLQNLDQGVAKVTDEGERAQLRIQSQRVVLWAVVSAAGLTTLSLSLP